MSAEKYLLLTVFLMIVPASVYLTLSYLPKSVQNWMQSHKWAPVWIILAFILAFTASVLCEF